MEPSLFNPRPPISWGFTISQVLNKTSFISVFWLDCQGTETELVSYDQQHVRNSATRRAVILCSTFMEVKGEYFLGLVYSILFNLVAVDCRLLPSEKTQLQLLTLNCTKWVLQLGVDNSVLKKRWHVYFKTLKSLKMDPLQLGVEV
jgi:hypothetical protein